MSLNELFVINSLGDAKDFLRKYTSESSRKVLATHVVANAFLCQNGINCQNVGSLAGNKALRKAYESFSDVNDFLLQMDNSLSAGIAEIFRIDKIDFFYTLYRYLLKYIVSRYIVFENVLSKFVKENGIEKIFLYEDSSFMLIAAIDPIKIFKERAQSVFGNKLEICALKSDFPDIEKISLLKKAFRLMNSPHRIPRYFKRKLYESLPFKIEDSKKTILFGFPLYDMEIIAHDPELRKKYNIIMWSEAESPKFFGIKSEITLEEERALAMLFEENLKEENPICDEMSFLSVFKRYLFENFKLNAKSLLLPLKWLNEYLNEYTLDLYLWGNSPSKGSKSLICEYIRSHKIKTLGAAHGGNFIIQDCFLDHYRSDFSRCDGFITYGSDEDDFNDLYPGEKLPCKIIPCGSLKELKLKSKKRKSNNKIDILFPIASAIPFFHGIRINAQMLYDWQVNILEALNSFSGMNIVVKPPPDFNISCFPSLMNMERFDNLKLVDIKLDDFFIKYDVSLVVTEFMSSPLYESLGRDVDIIAINEPVFPIKGKPLELLRKRAYFFDKIEDLINALVKYEKGHLPKLRNNEFYEKYIYRKDARERVLHAIESCLLDK